MMKKTITLLSAFFIISPTLLMAEPGKFIEIDIEKMKYEKPNASRGWAGDLSFSTVNMNWDGMQVNVRNEEKVFDTKILYKENYLGFLSPKLKVGFTLEPDSAFKAIGGLDITQSKVIANSGFFSFNGKEFQFIENKTKSRLNLKNFNLYCTGNGEYDLSTPEGIVAGCLSEFFVSGINGTLADAEIEYRDESGEKPFYLTSSLDRIDLKDDKITSNIEKAYILSSPFEITTKNLVATCKKDPELVTLDTDKLVFDCKNNLSVKNNLITIDNKLEQTIFDLAIDSFEVQEEKFSVSLTNAIINDQKTQTTLQGIGVDCTKDIEADVMDLQVILGECFKNGTASIQNIFSDEKNKSGYNNLRFNEYFDDSVLMRISGDADLKSNDSSVKDIVFKMKNNYLNVFAKVKFIWSFDISVDAAIKHLPDEEKIILSVEKTKLPLGIKWRKMLMYFLKKYLVVDFIEYQGNNIIITL